MAEKDIQEPSRPNSEEPTAEEPDKDIEFPAAHVVTEGYDPSQIKNNPSVGKQKK